MERKCSACGARISDGMKLCANCGKIIPPPRTNNPQRQPVRRSYSPDIAQQANTREFITERRQPSQPQKPVVAAKPQKNTKAMVFKCIKVAVIVFIIYAVVSAIQIFRVRFATYDFKVDMKMSQDNYGQAIDNFFDNGHWVYNPFTLTVTYTGEKKHEGDYELKFSTGVSVTLKSVEVDGKPKEDDKMESAIMGLFI